ncbi:MAG: hypothetical protein OEZ36_03100 [Spirochaetota bacterium]|nr:hypothetical protein [Spirochaetota bacterium]
MNKKRLPGQFFCLTLCLGLLGTLPADTMFADKQSGESKLNNIKKLIKKVNGMKLTVWNYSLYLKGKHAGEWLNNEWEEVKTEYQIRKISPDRKARLYIDNNARAWKLTMSWKKMEAALGEVNYVKELYFNVDGQLVYIYEKSHRVGITDEYISYLWDGQFIKKQHRGIYQGKLTLSEIKKPSYRLNHYVHAQEVYQDFNIVRRLKPRHFVNKVRKIKRYFTEINSMALSKKILVKSKRKDIYIYLDKRNRIRKYVEETRFGQRGTGEDYWLLNETRVEYFMPDGKAFFVRLKKKYDIQESRVEEREYRLYLSHNFIIKSLVTGGKLSADGKKKFEGLYFLGYHRNTRDIVHEHRLKGIKW